MTNLCNCDIINWTMMCSINDTNELAHIKFDYSMVTGGIIVRNITD